MKVEKKVRRENGKGGNKGKGGRMEKGRNGENKEADGFNEDVNGELFKIYQATTNDYVKL